MDGQARVEVRIVPVLETVHAQAEQLAACHSRGPVRKDHSVPHTTIIALHGPSPVWQIKASALTAALAILQPQSQGRSAPCTHADCIKKKHALGLAALPVRASAAMICSNSKLGSITTAALLHLDVARAACWQPASARGQTQASLFHMQPLARTSFVAEGLEHPRHHSAGLEFEVHDIRPLVANDIRPLVANDQVQDWIARLLAGEGCCRPCPCTRTRRQRRCSGLARTASRSCWRCRPWLAHGFLH